MEDITKNDCIKFAEWIRVNYNLHEGELWSCGLFDVDDNGKLKPILFTSEELYKEFSESLKK